MSERLRTLRDLQGLDRELRALREERAALPREAARREAEIAALRQLAEGSHGECRQAQARVKELDNDAAERSARIAKLEVQANMAKHTAELMALTHQVGTLKEEISKIEDQELALLDRVEELQSAGKRAREALEVEEKAFASFRAAMEADLVACEARLKERQERRDALARSVDPELLAKYARLLAARDGEAIARLDGQTCRGCFVEIPPNDFVRLVRGSEVVQCRHCQRILYLPEEEAAQGGAVGEGGPSGGEGTRDRTPA